ncbi:cytochrome P450 81Q32-like [Andrographis paniculata]|uniref:cytochrome P450 81Q32-like n=1 Tax=Andrographis paniculata TaxID=175694 RepID=UPI0021E6EBB4|nr:cytochrome P450 81Q32-like [Andrographis paniculata]
MDVTTLLCTTAVFAIFLISLTALRHAPPSRRRRLPPSPGSPLPVVGHLHLLKQPLHRTFQQFARLHGPIFSLKLGVRSVVVVASPDLVEECFTANDVVLSNRPWVLVDKYIGYDHTTMSGEPYGPKWRALRRLGAQEVLSAARLNAFSQIRHDQTRKTLKTLIVDSSNENWELLQLRPLLFELIFNMIMRMLAGKTFSGAGDRFREMVSEVFEHAQTSNPEDFLPFLLLIDYRGLKKKMSALGKKLDNFYRTLLEDHRRHKCDTIIGHLLSLQQSDQHLYTDQIIKGFITNMIIAGTDTSVVTLEWAMSLLLNNPEALHKAKQEIESEIGFTRLIEEQDLPKLQYLHSIILETFRLFPPGPLVVPRESSADCKIGGYDIPCGTIVLVNAWSIHRDPKVWESPTMFKPERFQGRKEVEMNKLMPFGMGRRACPGSGLGHRMVGLALGSLIQCFDWERLDRKEIDLSEGVGLTMPKLKPLEALYKPRQSIVKILQNN